MSQIHLTSTEPLYPPHDQQFVSTVTEEVIIPKDTIEQKVTVNDLLYKFEYGIFEATSSDVADVAKNFFSKSKMDTDILPPVTRWVSKDMSYIAVERPPFSVHIAYDDIHFEEGPINEDLRCEDCDPDYGCDCGYEADNLEWQSFEYTVNIPWTIWFFELNVNPYEGRTIQGAHLFCSPTSVQSLDSYLYCLPLPNLFDDDKVCWGNAHIPRSHFQNFSSYILGSINGFWTSRFNNDLVNNVGTLELGSYSYTREYLDLYSKLSMDEVLSADFTIATNSRGVELTFGSFCDAANAQAESQNNLNNNSANKASKFFKDLVQK